MQTGKKLGMCLMNDALLELVRRKIVDPKEAYAKSALKAELVTQFQRASIDTSWAPAAAP
jgi:twitching motility protein PilT